MKRHKNRMYPDTNSVYYFPMLMPLFTNKQKTFYPSLSSAVFLLRNRARNTKRPNKLKVKFARVEQKFTMFYSSNKMSDYILFVCSGALSPIMCSTLQERVQSISSVNFDMPISEDGCESSFPFPSYPSTDILLPIRSIENILKGKVIAHSCLFNRCG